MKKILSMLLAAALILSHTTVYGEGPICEDSVCEDTVYMPLWMQPHSVIIYDGNLEYTVVEGGELSEEEISESEDIALIGLEDCSEEMIASPNTKVEYDLHGFIQNVYYLVPGTMDEYQLSAPKQARVRSGIMDPGTTVTYGNYKNYDTGKMQDCVLTRSENGAIITGTGRITFYTGTYGEAGTHKLEAGDCATKMYYADVKSGTHVYASNTYAHKHSTFSKFDVGGLPKAILDVWSDSSVNPIQELTTYGTIDNVYSGSVAFAATAYD